MAGRPVLARVVRRDVFVWGLVLALALSGVLVNQQLGLGVWAAIYASLQAFATGMDVPPDARTAAENPGWDTAAWVFRIVAPIASAAALLQAAQFLGWMRRPLFGFRDHVVIVGAGRVGLEVARQVVAAGRRVIVIDKDGENPNLLAAESFGARALVADGASADALQSARIDRAIAIVAAARDDMVNLDATFRALSLHPKGRPLRAYAHIGDLTLRRSLDTLCRGKVPVTFFSLYEYAAQDLCREHIARRAVPISRLVVAGFGRFGEALMVELLPFLADGSVERCLVVDRNGRQRGRFEELREQLAPEVRHAIRLHTGEMLDRDIVAEMQSSEGPRLALICTDDDVRNLDLALTLGRQTGGNCRIVTRLFYGPPSILDPKLHAGLFPEGLFPEIHPITLNALLKKRFEEEIARL